MLRVASSCMRNDRPSQTTGRIGIQGIRLCSPGSRPNTAGDYCGCSWPAPKRLGATGGMSKSLVSAGYIPGIHSNRNAEHVDRPITPGRVYGFLGKL